MSQGEMQSRHFESKDQGLVLDEEALHSFLFEACGGDLLIAENLIEVYLESADSLLGMMTASLDKDDFRDLHYAAHTLKSSSRIFGASLLADLCDELELWPADGKRKDLAARVNEIGRQHRFMSISLVGICREIVKSHK